MTSKPVITLFTRAGCTLCDTVKFVIHKVARRVPLTYAEIDIAAPGNERWLTAYTNDIPVVHLGEREARAS